MPRNRKNPKLLKAEGAYASNPGRISGSVEASEGRPHAPNSVSACPVAEAIWNETLDFLEDMGILTLADEHVLVLYCTTYAELVKLTKLVQDEGHVITDDKGNVKANPHSVAWDRTKASWLKLAGQLGLTPSARAGLPGPPKMLNKRESAADSLLSELGV